MPQYRTKTTHSFGIRQIGGPGDHAYGDDPSKDEPSKFLVTLIEYTYTYGKTGKIIDSRTLRVERDLCALDTADLTKLVQTGLEALSWTVQAHDDNAKFKLGKQEG